MVNGLKVARIQLRKQIGAAPAERLHDGMSADVTVGVATEEVRASTHLSVSERSSFANFMNDRQSQSFRGRQVPRRILLTTENSNE